MSTAASIGHGSSFERSSDGTSSGTFTAVAGIKNISGPGISKNTHDVTDMDSSERWMEFISGLKDGGEVSLDVEFNPDGTDVTNWLADINADTNGYYKIVFPDATEWGFSAIMTGFEPDTPHDDVMTASVSYKVSGKPAFIV